MPWGAIEPLYFGMAVYINVKPSVQAAWMSVLRYIISLCFTLVGPLPSGTLPLDRFPQTRWRLDRLERGV